MFNSDDFHDKYGIFEFDDESTIAFDGSANETLNGLLNKVKQFQFIEVGLMMKLEELILLKILIDWNGDNKGLEIKSLPEALRDKIFKSAPKEIEEEIKSIMKSAVGNIKKSILIFF